METNFAVKLTNIRLRPSTGSVFSLLCLFVVILIALFQVPSLSVRSVTWDFSAPPPAMVGSPLCKPVTRLVFIKTHKTASTTTAAIFERYGYLRNLSFAVPRSRHVFSNTKLFKKSMVYKFPNRSRSDFDMLVNHARFNHKEMDKTVIDSRYVSIIRDPIAQLESAFGYFEMATRLKIKTTNPFMTFISDPKKYYKKKSHMWFQSRNGQLFDFGLDHKYDNDQKRINEIIDGLLKDIDLMMINEYYDESLILLKSLMCWDFDDILYISNGIRSKSHRLPVTDKMIANIKKWNAGDIMLYERFNTTFWTKVADYGPSFERDLEYFRMLERNVTVQCVDMAKNDTKDRREDKAVLKENSTKYCQDLLRGDVEYTKLIRQAMVQRIDLEATKRQNRTSKNMTGNQTET